MVVNKKSNATHGVVYKRAGEGDRLWIEGLRKYSGSPDVSKMGWGLSAKSEMGLGLKAKGVQASGSEDTFSSDKEEA